jgi:prepilin-type N-terminal cleavage/methylation domain-containing protein
MNVHHLHRWHWMLVGLILGFSCGAGRMLSDMEDRIGGPGFITQARFENDLRVPPIAGRPYVKGITIRPATTGIDVDIVSFQEMHPETAGYREFHFVAPRPYRPRNTSAPGGQKDSVRDFLKDAAAINPSISFEDAWWRAPRATLGLYTLAGLLLIGGIWPALLRLISKDKRAPSGPAYDLDRFHHDPAGKPSNKTTSEDEERLAALEREMVKGMRDSSYEAPAATTTSTPSVKPVLFMAQDADGVPAVTDRPNDQKDYVGQFYPVERQAPHGFTLVELLVVVGILTVLISLLMPAMRIVRLEAQTVQCAAQLRQVGLALHLYANANKGWLPAWSGWHAWPPRPDEQGPAWTVEMIPYLGSPDSPVYNCPSFPGPRCRNYFLASQWAGRSGRNAMKLSDVTMASRFVLGGDKTNPYLYPPPLGSQLYDDADPDDFGSTGPLLWPWNGGFYMHFKGDNILFDDGHVALFARYDPAAMTFNPHAMEDWPNVTAD